jgi:hypothetical protein
MRIDFALLLCFLIVAFSPAKEAFGIESGGKALASCEKRLKDLSLPFKSPAGISVYRIFNVFPPVGRGEIDHEPIVRSIKSRVKSIDLASDCFPERLLKSAMWYGPKEMQEVLNDDVVPVRVLSGEKGYFVVFLYPGYIERDGTGTELAAGVAVYGKGGELVQVFEGVSSWAGNEGTLLMRESCLYGETISFSNRRFYPDQVSEDGYVITYDLMFDISKTMKYLFSTGGDRDGGYECPSSSYIKVGKK